MKKDEARRATPSLPLPHHRTEQTRPRCPTVHLFFVAHSFPSSFLPSSSLPARTRRHAAATWQRLFAGGWKKRKSASLFCCLSQQLSQGPCLRGRKGRLSLIFSLSLLLALPSLSLSLSMHAFAINCKSDKHEYKCPNCPPRLLSPPAHLLLHHGREFFLFLIFFLIMLVLAAARRKDEGVTRASTALRNGTSLTVPRRRLGVDPVSQQRGAAAPPPTLPRAPPADSMFV